MRYQVMKKENFVIYALGAYAFKRLILFLERYPISPIEYPTTSVLQFVKQIVVNSAKWLFKFADVAHRFWLYVKVHLYQKENREISIFVPSTYRSNISLHTALLFEFSRSKINLKVSILVVSLRKNISRFEWLTNQKAKDYFELIFWNLERLLTLFYIVSFT